MAKDKLITRKFRVMVVLKSNPYMRPREMYVRDIDNLPEGWVLAKGERDVEDQYARAYRGKARVQA